MTVIWTLVTLYLTHLLIAGKWIAFLSLLFFVYIYLVPNWIDFRFSFVGVHHQMFFLNSLRTLLLDVIVNIAYTTIKDNFYNSIFIYII